MKRLLLRSFCLAAALLLLLTALPSCQKNNSNPFAQNGFSSITLNKEGEIQATASFNSLILESREGDMVRLYEVMPGETVANALKKDPITERKIGAEVIFRIPLTDNEHNRIYSSFLLCLSDGTLLTPTPTYITIPKGYAPTKAAPLLSNTPKGLPAQNAAAVAALETGRVMAEISLSALLTDGDMTLTFDGRSVKVNSAALAELDRQIQTASRLGMEASLTLILDSVLPIRDLLPIPHHLANRYDGEEHGTLSALYLDDGGQASADFSATLLLFSRTAMLSRVENSRVYLMTSRTNPAHIKAFFSSVAELLSARGGMDWGAALRMPELGNTPWLSSDTDTVTLQGLSELRTSLLAVNGGKGAPARLALCGVSLPQEEEAAALSAAYLYRVAAGAGYTSIFFADTPAPNSAIAKVLTMADRGFSDDVEQLCARKIGSAWTEMPPHRTTNKLVVGAATTDRGGLRYDTWLDFSKNSTHDFTAVNGLYEPTLKDSATYGKPVLYTWLISPGEGEETGVLRVMDSARELQGVSAISVQTLPQLPDGGSCLLTLRLRGFSPSGTPLTYESGVEIHSGSWQTVSFSVAGFVAEADLSAPCTLSLVTDSAPAAKEGEEPTPYVLWLKEIAVRRPQSTATVLTAALLSLLGVLVGFAVTLLLFRRKRARKAPSAAEKTEVQS